MRHELTPDTLKDFQSQFHALSDTVIESIYLETGQKDFSMTIKSTSLKRTETEFARYDLVFQLEEVADVRIINHPNIAFDVILDAHIEFIDGNIGINFHPANLELDTDFMSNVYKESQILVVAKRCFWKATKSEPS